MSEFKFKLKKIYFPFILLSLGLFTFCNLLRYLLDFKLGILNISESLTEFWIPFALPIVPIFFWFNKKAKLLKFKNYNRYLNYLAFASLLVAFPIVISQKQIKKIVFKIIEIENPEEIRKYPNERFFRIKKYNVLKNNLCESTKYVKSIRKYRGGNTDAKTYLIYANKFKNTKSIWYGTFYKKILYNKNENEAQLIEKKEFYKKSRIQFEKFNFRNAKYFERKSNDADKQIYIKAIKNCEEKIESDKQIILEPRNNNLDNNITNIIKKYLIFYLVIFIIFYLMNMKKKINYTHEKIKH